MSSQRGRAELISEKRRFPRKNLFSSAVMQIDSFEGEPVTNFGILKDISPGGLCLTLYEFNEQALHENIVFDVKYKLPNDTEYRSNRCRASRLQKFNYTVQIAGNFIEMDSRDKNALQQFCM